MNLGEKLREHRKKPLILYKIRKKRPSVHTNAYTEERPILLLLRQISFL